MEENEMNVKMELGPNDYALLNEIIEMDVKKAMLVKALWNKFLSEMQNDDETDP